MTMDFKEIVRDVYKEEAEQRIRRAYDFARAAHVNQKRASGEEYFSHPCAVAKILVDLGMDDNTVAAAFLHDVIEDTPATDEDIGREFGMEILELVQGVTKLERIEFKSKEEEQAENFRKIFVAMAKDIRVIIIKLADRLHNMRSLNFLSHERQQRMARETLEIFAPLAGRLGISQIKCELEDLCLKYLEPEYYSFLVENINTKLGERREFVDEVVGILQEMLRESNIRGEVFGRPKHFFSIYKKMKNQNKSLEQVYDLTAVRVVVESIDACYEVFGKIHKRWKPVPGRIKDYIATPKPNMYQSLHTTVVTNFGQTFEIQIRTYEMHRTAEYGIAAHWKYKEKRNDTDSFNERLSWIREVMEWQGGIKDSKEFLQSLKGDVYNSEVLVFTPKGDVISLPKEATPIDFAYHIHTAVGHKCVGAKVNSKMVPLTTSLQVGDVVEVITSTQTKGPSWDWLKIVKSPAAKAKIRQFFKKEMKEENVKLGKSMLEAEAKRRGYVLSDILTNESFERIAPKLSFTSQDEMFASVGYGAVTTGQVLFKLIDFYRKETPKISTKTLDTKKESAGGVIVKGVSGLMIRFAGCCNPVPGDAIVGFVSRGRGVAIHRADCPNMKNVERERLLPAEWSGERAKNSYLASISILVQNRSGMLETIGAIVSGLNLDITAVNGRVGKDGHAVIDITVRLQKRQDLENLIAKLGQDPAVIDVYRTAT